MSTGRAKRVSIVGASVIVLSLGGVAGAAPAGSPQAKGTDPGRQQEAALKAEVGDLKRMGLHVKDAQARTDKAASRARGLDEQRQDLNGEPRARRGAVTDSRGQPESGAGAASKGEDAGNVSRSVDQVSRGKGDKDGPASAGRAANQTGNREGVRENRDSERALAGTITKLRQREVAYARSREEQRTYAEEPRRREAELASYVGALGTKEEPTEARLAQLEEADRAGLFTRPPASGYGGGGAATRAEEIEIAKQDIVADPVEPIPYRRYIQIYKASAKRYGFADDWYVLAAVGKVESGYGENMGPSSAGAMGPMQFLPSTWKEYGVDGNGDGIANVMDPEDAIPAAAGYLLAGGAPEDWYAALYTYNHAGWYVREVLGIAEGYRRLAKDDKVEPYV